MKAIAVSLCLALGPSAWDVSATRQSEVHDPEVAKGVEQVEQGDYDTAILTLDAAARRLAGKPAFSGQLAQAYLYLGIAYLGKGHETSAKAQFREALARVSDLKLSPDKFAPRVIEIFEKARDEIRQAVEATREKKGGSKKGLILLGVGGAAAAGVAVAAAGGGSPAASGDSRKVATFPGTTTPDGRGGASPCRSKPPGRSMRS